MVAAAESYLPEINNAINQDNKTVFINFKPGYEKNFPEIIIKSARDYWIEYVYRDQIDSDKIELMNLDFYFKGIRSVAHFYRLLCDAEFF